MRANRQKISLPIGRTAMLAYQIDSLRTECCEAAEKMTQQKPLNEAELEECARLDDALADAQRLLKCTITNITVSRIRRRSRAK